jgi:plastocyanin domain-containing protein
MPDYNIRKSLQYGENIIEFTPAQTGIIRFSCWMQMVWGKFIVEA